MSHIPTQGGKWSRNRGESDFILDEPLTLSDGRIVERITYRNAVPDFSPYQEAQVKITEMVNKREVNFRKADEVFAEFWTRIRHGGKAWTPRDIAIYRNENDLTWREMSNMDSMQLVPSAVNQRFPHCGGVSEYNAMIGQEGMVEFD